MLVVLLVAAGARGLLSRRASPGALPGAERDVAATLDTVEAMATEEARRGRPLGAGERLDPNRADEIELDRLPGVGPATAGAIARTRALEPFLAPNDLLRAPGIGPATLEKLQPYLEFSVVPRGIAPPGLRRSRPRISVNGADSVTLLALPGIGPALAGRIVRAREEDGAFRSLDELARVPGIGPATVARLRDHAQIR